MFAQAPRRAGLDALLALAEARFLFPAFRGEAQATRGIAGHAARRVSLHRLAGTAAARANNAAACLSVAAALATACAGGNGPALLGAARGARERRVLRLLAVLAVHVAPRLDGVPDATVRAEMAANASPAARGACEATVAAGAVTKALRAVAARAVPVDAHAAGAAPRRRAAALLGVAATMTPAAFVRRAE